MAEPQDMAWKDSYRYLEEEVPDEQVGPVGRVVGDGEARVLAEASQLFPDFKRCHPSFSL